MGASDFGTGPSSLDVYLIIIISGDGMGERDSTFTGALGFILGAISILFVVFLSFVIGALVSVVLLTL